MRKVLYILGQLDDRDIEWMAHAGVRRRFADGEVLITEGRPTPDLFIVLDGEVEVEVAGVGVVARLGSGEVLGEMSFVDKAPPSATVRGAGAADVLTIDKRCIEDRLAENAAFAGRFYKALAIFLADRLRATTKRKAGGGKIDASAIEEDELDESVLDGVSMAGVRFRQMLATLGGGKRG